MFVALWLLLFVRLASFWLNKHGYVDYVVYQFSSLSFEPKCLQYSVNVVCKKVCISRLFVYYSAFQVWNPNFYTHL